MATVTERIYQLVEEHLRRKPHLPVFADFVANVAFAVQQASRSRPMEFLLAKEGPAEFAFGRMMRRAGKTKEMSEFRVNAASLGTDHDLLKDLSRLHSLSIGKDGLAWVPVEHPLVVRILEGMHRDLGAVEVGGGRWGQNGNRLTDSILNDLFADEIGEFAAVHPERVDDTSFMPTYRNHVAAVYAEELAQAGRLSFLVRDGRAEVAARMNTALEAVGMHPVFEAADDPLGQPISVADDILVSLAWNMGLQTRRDNWPSGGALPEQVDGKGDEGWRGPSVMSMEVYPILATDALRRRLDEQGWLSAKMNAQALRSLMHQGLGPHDQDWESRLRGMKAGMVQDKSGAMVALTQAGRALHEAFPADLTLARQNIRVKAGVPGVMVNAVPFRNVGYEWGYSAHNVTREEGRGSTKFLLVYRQGSVISALGGLTGRPVPPDIAPLSSHVPSLELKGTVSAARLTLTEARIRGQMRGHPRFKFGTLMKFHPILFAEAIGRLAAGQHHTAVTIKEGMDSAYRRDYRRLPNPKGVADFVRSLIATGEAALKKPLKVPLASVRNPMVAELTELPAGTYRMSPRRDIYLHTRSFSVRRDEGSIGRQISIHYASMANGEWQGLEPDPFVVGLSGTANNETMPTLKVGLNIQARAEGWTLKGDKLTFRTGSYPPHMRINGQVAELDVAPGRAFIRLEPLLGERVEEETYRLDEQEHAWARNLLDTLRQLRMFGKADQEYWDGNVKNLRRRDNLPEAKALGARLARATLHGMRGGGDGR